MKPVPQTEQIEPTRSRQILGSTTDFDTLLKIADAPPTPTQMRRPRDVGVQLLASGE
jgi:hypothetical protein